MCLGLFKSFILFILYLFCSTLRAEVVNCLVMNLFFVLSIAKDDGNRIMDNIGNDPPSNSV